MSKYIAFDIDDKVHKQMKRYLVNLDEEKTIKSYITELIERDLKSKSFLREKEDEEEF